MQVVVVVVVALPLLLLQLLVLPLQLLPQVPSDHLIVHSAAKTSAQTSAVRRFCKAIPVGLNKNFARTP